MQHPPTNPHKGLAYMTSLVSRAIFPLARSAAERSLSAGKPGHLATAFCSRGVYRRDIMPTTRSFSQPSPRRRRQAEREVFRLGRLHAKALLGPPAECLVISPSRAAGESAAPAAEAPSPPSMAPLSPALQDGSAMGRWRRLQRGFQGADAAGEGTVTMQQMVAILRREGLDVGEEEMLDLMLRYDKCASPIPRRNPVVQPPKWGLRRP